MCAHRGSGEDSVAPLADKAGARTTALDYVPRLAWRSGSPPPALTCALRLNGIDSMSGLADWQAFIQSEADPTFLVVPKVDSPGHLQILDSGCCHRARRQTDLA